MVAAFNPNMPVTEPLDEWEPWYTYGPTGFTPTNYESNQITLYWVAGGAQKVDVSPYFYGLNATHDLVANFSVKIPVISSATVTMDNFTGNLVDGNGNPITAQNGVYLDPSMGTATFGQNKDNPGATFLASQDPSSPAGFQLGWCQLITAHTINYVAEGPYPDKSYSIPGPGLDEQFPYRVDNSTGDAPNVAGLETFKSGNTTVSYSFTMWLMCQPTGDPKNIWVPLEEVSKAQRGRKESAGQNRHGVADERAAQERNSEPS